MEINISEKHHIEKSLANTQSIQDDDLETNDYIFYTSTPSSTVNSNNNKENVNETYNYNNSNDSYSSIKEIDKLNEGTDSYVNILEEQLEQAVEKIDKMKKEVLNKKVSELEDQIKYEVSLKEEGFKDYEKKIVKLNQKCDHLMNKDKIKSKEIEMSNNALKDVKKKYEQEIKKKENYKRQINKVYNDNVKMKKDNEIYKYKVEQLSNELKNMANRIETLESNERAYKTQIKNENGDNETMKSLKKEYEKKLNEKNKIINEKEQENIQLKKDDEAFKSNICKQLDSLFVDCKNRQANNQIIIEEKNKEISDIINRNKTLIEENKVKEEEINRLNDTINKQVYEFKTLQSTLEKKEKEYKLKEKEIEELNQKYKEVKKNQELSNAENYTVERKKNLEVLEEYKIKLDKSNDQLNKTLKELDELKKNLENKNAELTDLTNKNKYYNKITEDYNNLKLKNKELYKSLEDLNKYKEEGKQKEREIMELNQEIGNLNKIVDSNKKKDIEIERLNKVLDEERKREIEIYKQKERKIKDLSQKIEQLNRFEKKLEEKSNEVEKLTLQIETLENEKTAFQTIEKNLNEELLLLENENKIKNEEIKKYNEDISALHKTENEFKQKEEQFINHIQELKGNEIKYKQEFMRKEDYWQSKINELNNNVQEVEILKNKEIKNKIDEIKKLTKDLESNKNEIKKIEDKYENDINKMKKYLEDKNKELNDLSLDYQKKKEELDDLRDKSDKNSEEIMILKQTNENNIEKLKNLNITNNKEIENWKQRHTKITEELEKIKNIFELKKNELENANKNIIEKEKKLVLINEAYQKSKEDIVKYTIQIDQLKQKYISDDKELELMKQKYYLKEKEIEDVKNKLVEKEKEIKDLNGKILNKENEINNLSRNNNKLELANADLLSKENNYISQISMLKDQWEKLEQTRKSMNDDNCNLREKIKELNEINLKQGILIKEESFFKKEIEKLNEENEKLKNNIHEYEVASVSCLQQLHTITSDLNLARKEIEGLKEKLETSEEEKKEYEEFKEKYEAYKEKYEAYKEKFEEYKEKFETSEEEKKVFEVNFENSKNEIKKLTEQLSSIQMEKKKLEEKLKNDKFLNTKENLVIINDNNKDGKSENLGVINNENFNLIHEKNKINKEFKQMETNNEQLNKIIENLKIQLSVKDNEILMEKIKQDKCKNELDTLKSNYMKEINRQQLEIKIKDIELKDYKLKYNNLKQKVGDDNNNDNLKNNMDINEEIMAVKKELESNSKIELENEKNVFKKKFERELNRKEEAMENRIKVVEMKADEEVEIYKKKLLEKTKNEIEEFRKNYNIIQLNEIRQKEKELDKKIKEAIIIKKRELVHQENKVFTARKHEIESAFYKLIKEKQHELEEKYQKRIMNLKYIIDNTPQFSNDEGNKSIAKIINDLKDEILSLNESLSLEKQINENNTKKIKSLEENHKSEIKKLLKSHFNNIDNNTIFNNKTLSLFDKDYLEKIYNDITSKMNENIYLQESKDDKKISSDSLNKNSYMKERLNEIYAVFQIYTWKLHDTIEEYENQIKSINWSQKLNESTTSITQNDELIKLENKFKLLLEEKEAEYLRILTELELDNYMKETSLIEQSLLNNKNFDNLHYEEQLKALEEKYQSCIKVIDNEKKSSSVLTNENKKLRQMVEKDRRTIEYDNKLLKKYKRQIDFLEKTLNIETQGRDKVLQGYIQQIHQDKGKRGKTKTAEFVNIDGVINACKRGDDDQRTDDDNRQKDGHSELTTEDFINSLNTDRYNTRENDNKDDHSEETENDETENEDKETDTMDLDSYDTTTRTTEMSTELNTEEIKKEEEEEEEEEDDDDDDDENGNENENNNNNSNNDYDDEHLDQDNNKRNDNDNDSDNDNDEVDDDEDDSMTLDNHHKKRRKGKIRYSKMDKSLGHSNKINKDKKEYKKLRLIKKDKRVDDSHRKKETINKEDIFPKNYNNEKYDLRNNKDKNKPIEVFDNDYLESSEEEEEVSESIKEEIRTLLEDIPELKNKYYILNKIGEGTFSSVYKALCIDEEKKRKERIRKKRENKYYAKKIKDKKYYALKRIYATSSPQRIENEISILHDLRKKSNIVSIYSCVRYEDQVILVLPYVQHNDFRNYLNTMTMDDIRYYMISILTALKHCHELYIMHRDIKPSNFLYDVKNRTGVLVDFGLAQRMDEADIAASKAAKKTLQINSHSKRPLGEMSGNINSESHNKKLKTGKKTAKTLKTKLLTNSNSNNNNNNNTVVDNDEEDSTNNENRYVPDINNEIPIDIPTFNNGKIHPLSVMATVPKYGKPGYIKNDVRPAIRANRAGTRGFRAPEVLFKCVHQTVAIDIWSVGVILLSMFTQRFPFFNSNDDYEALLELGCIFGKQRMKYVAYVLERTYETNIPSVDRYISFQKLCQSLNPKKYIPKEGIDFLTCLLTLDPKSRITAKEALEHPFLKNFDEKEDDQSITDDKINE